MRGTVRMYDNVKGYGFIRPDEISQRGERDLFFHCSAMLDGAIPSTGDSVEFQKGNGRDGRPCAVHVSVVRGPVRYEDAA